MDYESYDFKSLSIESMLDQVVYKLVYVIGSGGLGSSDAYPCTKYYIGIHS